MFHVVSFTWSKFSESWIYSNEAHRQMPWLFKFLLIVQLWRLFTKQFSRVLGLTVNGMCRHDNMSYLEKLKNSVLLLDRNLEDKVCSSRVTFKLDWQPSVDAVINTFHDILKFTCNFHVVRNYLYIYTWSCVYLATTECDKAELLFEHRWSRHWRGTFEECCSGSWVRTFTSNSFLCSFRPVDCGCLTWEAIIQAWADLWAQETLTKSELFIEAIPAVDNSLDWY